ncbi:ribonuclease H-like domain-containing protein [Psychrobacillus vulpis]|uniref:Exonuclease n=1 Tax=Psychrobacillus vulpis TaxID=2325572 RepID=A0A544TQJ4_9BACI|nr:ribonuclease H-like domain-containing protein [Psychrobacillus vulpis]TQR19738.1 exonuclease [Psychrobacillus vulpis]
MSYEKKLMQMKGLVKKNSPSEQTKKEVPNTVLPFYTEMWEKAGLSLIQNEHGFLFVKEIFYPEQHIHGNIELQRLTEAVSFMQEKYPGHPLTFSPNSAFCFYDIETTGLRGTGVLIFLNGVLNKVENGFLLTQYVLADPSQESAFLFASDFWKESKTIVTYNGKSFDIPQLVSRWTMNRNFIPKLKIHEQIDLMHSSKRIWKGDLDRFKLKQVEEQKLGFVRKDDIPGHLAPIIYFDAVKHGNPSNLMKVLKHNEWDILSLVTLYILTVELLKENEVVESAITYTNIGKWFQDLKTMQAGFDWFQFVVRNFSSKDVSLAYYYVGLHLKRRKLYDESIKAFLEALKEIDGKYRIEVFIELAKLFEHQEKNYDMALQMTDQCMAYIESLYKSFHLTNFERHKQDNLKRRKRIIRKINISRETAQPNKKRGEMP